MNNMPTDEKKMADHKWEQGAYGVCKRCGTDPEISIPKDRHPK